MTTPIDQPDRHRALRVQFARLWGQAETSVAAFVFSLVPSFHDAEDLVQQIAEEVAERFDEYDPSRPFEAWVIWLAKKRVIDHFRKLRRDRLVFDDALIERVAEIHTQRSQRGGPATGADHAEALEHCLDQLPDKSRRLLDQRYVDNLTPTQIAESAGSTSGSIRVQLHRLRDLLAECIRRRVAREVRS